MWLCRVISICACYFNIFLVAGKPGLHADFLQEVQRRITCCGSDTKNLYFDKSATDTRATWRHLTAIFFCFWDVHMFRILITRVYLWRHWHQMCLLVYVWVDFFRVNWFSVIACQCLVSHRKWNNAHRLWKAMGYGV